VNSAEFLHQISPGRLAFPQVEKKIHTSDGGSKILQAWYIHLFTGHRPLSKAKWQDPPWGALFRDLRPRFWAGYVYVHNGPSMITEKPKEFGAQKTESESSHKDQVIFLRLDQDICVIKLVRDTWKELLDPTTPTFAFSNHSHFSQQNGIIGIALW